MPNFGRPTLAHLHPPPPPAGVAVPPLTADIIMTVIRQESKITKSRKWFPSFENFTNWFTTLPVITPITTAEIMGIYNQKPQSSVKRLTKPDIPESFIRGYQATVFFPIEIMQSLYNQVNSWISKRRKNIQLPEFFIWSELPQVRLDYIMTLYNQVNAVISKRRNNIQLPDMPSWFYSIPFIPAITVEQIMALYNQVVDTFTKRISRHLPVENYTVWFNSIPAIVDATVEQIMAVFNNVKPFIAKSRLYTKIPESFTMGYQAVVFFPIDIAMGIYNQVVETWRKRTTWFNVPESYFAWINALPQVPTLTEDIIMGMYNQITETFVKRITRFTVPESYTVWFNSIPIIPPLTADLIMGIYNQVKAFISKRIFQSATPESYTTWINVPPPVPAPIIDKKSINIHTLDAGVDLRHKRTQSLKRDLLLTLEVETRARFINPLELKIPTKTIIIKKLEVVVKTKARFVAPFKLVFKSVVTMSQKIETTIPTRAKRRFDKVINTLKEYLNMEDEE